MKTYTYKYATLQKRVVFVNFVLQTLNVLRASPAKIISAQVTPLSMNIVPAVIAGNGAATLCAGIINSAVSSATISIDAMNATIQ